MKEFILAAVALGALAIPLAAGEAHGDCDSNGNIALGIVTIDAVAATIYIDDRNVVPGLGGNGLWAYLESNGLPGLQRGGSSPIVPDDNEVCFDDSENGPDQLLV
jgi:hypothetical protein